MKRPQSAKPGYRAPALQNSADQVREQEFSHKNLHRKQVKLLKPDLTQNDFARIMPKKIYQDKERLYSQGLQLKQKLNQFQEENIRLKTRISILEKQKDKLSKAMDVAAQATNKSQSRFKMYQGPVKSSDAENTRIRNLTKIVRESKQENEYLRQQNAKIKKAVKFTKINEVEIQCKILREEYQKLEQLLVEMNEKLADQDEYEKQINELKNYLEEEVQANKELSQSNQKYIEYIQELETKLKKQNEKNQQKQKKMQREFALQKRKLNQATKLSDDLRKQLRALRQAPQNVVKPKPLPFSRPMSSKPYTTNSEQNKQALAKLEQMKQKNQKLQKELKEVKQKLESSGFKQNQKSPQLQKKYRQNSILFVQPVFQQNKPEQQKGGDFILKQEKKVEPQNSEYFDEFQEQDSTKKEEKKKESPKKHDAHIENYNRDFEDEDVQQEQLYTKQAKKEQEKLKQKQKQKEKEKEQEKQKKQQKQKQKEKEKPKKKKTEQKKDQKNSNYQPNKQILSQIKQLLTYRMKAQRYPYEQLQKDIIASKENSFSMIDLEGMLKSQPFYLTPGYTRSLIEYIFEKKVVNDTESVTTAVLLQKLKKMIKNFQLIDEKQQEARLMSIAEMTTQYPNQLQNAFEKIKNGPDTVARKDLVQMFKKLELADHFIQVIIAELSLCSNDLQHLSIRGYFQRFYVDEMQNEQNAIDQEQIESSGEQKVIPKSKIHKIDEEDEYSDDKVNFLLEDEAQLSMKGKSKGKDIEYNNEDIVSDDGRI